MSEITLVVLAAGIGSRYGATVKQLERVGPSGEIIMDYSVHDAIEAGFDRVVFIVRRDIYDDFMEVAGSRLEARFRALGISWDYAFQSTEDLPAGRTKPWGTGQAVLACAELIRGPFAVINADDYYGKDAMAKAYAFLAGHRPEDGADYGMVGFVLKNTLSEEGGVTRGLCATDGAGYLTDVAETRNIIKVPGGAAVRRPDGALRLLDGDSLVSMNLWMLTPQFVGLLDGGFRAFREGLADPVKDEYLLPDIIGRLVRAKKARVKVLPTEGQWYGITYPADRRPVAEAIRAMVEAGVYQADLFADLT